MSALDIVNILKDAEEGAMTLDEIIEKYKITKYKYYQIVKSANIKKKYRLTIKKNKVSFKREKTEFQKMLEKSLGTKEEKDENSFDKEGFIKDCKEWMKIVDLMEKYGMSLYQVRESKKKFDCKSR